MARHQRNMSISGDGILHAQHIRGTFPGQGSFAQRITTGSTDDEEKKKKMKKMLLLIILVVVGYVLYTQHKKGKLAVNPKQHLQYFFF